MPSKIKSLMLNKLVDDITGIPIRPEVKKLIFEIALC